MGAIVNMREASLPIVVLAVLMLGACSVGDSTSGKSAGGPSVEVAVSETCVAGSSSQCVLANGENVMLPSELQEVRVQDATVIASNGQSNVQVTFTDDGSRVLKSVTQQAVQAGNAARLIVMASGEIIAAPVVLATIDSRETTIALSPDTDAQAIVDLFLKH